MTVLALTCLAVLPAQSVEQGEDAPAWRGQDFDGQQVEFPALLEGKPTVMVFWATWCGYCRAFMPYLEGIQNDYGAEQINYTEDGWGPGMHRVDMELNAANPD